MNPLNRSNIVGRREFIAQSVGASAVVAGAGLWPASASTIQDRSDPGGLLTSFFVVGDTHFLADKERPAAMDATSSTICGRLVDTLNRLPGTSIPVEAGGGEVARVSGVIHAGDVIDTGDKGGRVHEEMQRTEWAAFADTYGLTGKDGRLQVPVYEVFGNHDAPQGTGHALEKIKERNRKRPGLIHVSENGVHYSWDWGKAHFINLGLIVGDTETVTRKRRYAALGSLDFLIADVKEHVGTSGRPVILTHHVDVGRYTGHCDPEAPANSKEWDACDVRAYYEVIKNLNVVGIFYGHTHTRDVFQWDGQSKLATTGIRVFNTDNASHFSGTAQAFFYVELYERQLVVREYMTRDGWQTGAFTPQVWRSPVAS